MSEFITVQLILSLAGCVGIVISTTQLFKRFIKLDPKIIALIMSIVLGIGRIIVMEKYDFVSIFIGILNIIPILFGAIGGYDTIIKPKVPDKSENIIEDIEKNKNESNSNNENIDKT